MVEWKRRMAHKAVTQLWILGLSSSVPTSRHFCQCNGRRRRLAAAEAHSVGLTPWTVGLKQQLEGGDLRLGPPVGL